MGDCGLDGDSEKLLVLLMLYQIKKNDSNLSKIIFLISTAECDERMVFDKNCAFISRTQFLFKSNIFDFFSFNGIGIWLLSSFSKNKS